MEWRLLRADEIELRAGQKTKDGAKQSLLLYKDARCDMARLDEQFGQYGWQRDHKDIHGVSYCGVGLWNSEHNCWVWKWDAGDNTNDDPKIAAKGEASDAFKRACVNWGIGRELYSVPQIWIAASYDPRKLHVSEINYNEKREIVHLVIVDEKNAVVFSKGKAAQPAPAAPIEKKGGAIYPAKEEPAKPRENGQQTDLDKLDRLYGDLSERELHEYNDALRLAKESKTKQDALGVYARYKEAVFAPLLLDFCIKLKAERGWT